MPRFRRYFLGFAVVVLLSAAALYASAFVYVIEHSDGDPAFTGADCGIVFGAALRKIEYEGSPRREEWVAGPGIRRRVSSAVDLYRRNLLRRLIVTGGKGQGSDRSEAEAMGEFARAQGVRASDITLESRAKSTKENLLFSRPLTSGCSSIVAISDGYHLARIKLLAQTMDWDLSTYPAPGNAGVWFIVRSSLREAAGITLLVLSTLLT